MSTRTQPTVQQSPQFPILDTLRAVGALAVLTTHTTFQSGDYGRHGTWGILLSRLDIGVAIFFVLSGFLLSRPYLARATAGLPGPAAGRYYWKRTLRVYPVYAATVVIALGLMPENADAGPRAWLRTLLLLDVYTTDRLPYGLTQMWSLAAEVVFYLMLPLLMLTVLGRGGSLRPTRVAALLVALVALSVWWHVDLARAVGDVTTGVPMSWLPAYLTWFAVGIGLALGHVLVQERAGERGLLRLLPTLAGMPGVSWTIIVGLMLVAATPLAGPTWLVVATPGQSLTKHLLYAVIGGLVVLTGVFPVTNSRYERLMSARPLRHLGHISYSTFCIHLPVLYLVMSAGGYTLFGGNGLQIWLLTIVISLLASEALYRLVEKPGMRLRNLGRRTGASAPSPSSEAQTATTK